METKLDAPTAKEEAWIQTQLAGARRFVAEYSPDDADQPLTLPALDRAWAAWLATEEANTSRVNSAINVVGVAFGQILVEGTPLRWMIATDAQGSDLALYGFPGQGDVLVYPCNFVAKRYERRVSCFLESSYRDIVRCTQQVTASHAAPAARRPWWKFW